MENLWKYDASWYVVEHRYNTVVIRNAAGQEIHASTLESAILAALQLYIQGE